MDGTRRVRRTLADFTLLQQTLMALAGQLGAVVPRLPAEKVTELLGGFCAGTPRYPHAPTRTTLTRPTRAAAPQSRARPCGRPTTTATG